MNGTTSRAWIPAALVALALLMAACGGSSEATESRPGRQAMSTGGLPFGYAANPDEATRTIEVTTTDSMSYEPGRISVGEGETIRFVVTNEGNLPHEFALGDEESQATHEKEMVDGMMAHDHPFSVYLEAGETKEFAWTFPTAGRFSYACHVPGHYTAGMKAPLVVD